MLPQGGNAPDAVDLLSQLIGRHEVEMKGFRPSTAIKGAWSHPDIPFIPAPASPMDLVATMVRTTHHRRWQVVLAALALAIMVFAAGVLTANMRLTSLLRASMSEATPLWTVVRIEQRGVVVQTSGSLKDPGRRVLIPVGDKLPNGDVVVSVLPERNTVVLGSGALVRKSQAKEPPHGR